MFTDDVTPEQDGLKRASRLPWRDVAQWAHLGERASGGGTEDPRLERLNACALDERSWRDRLWAWLGFGHARAPRDIEEGAEERAAAEGFVPSYLITDSYISWDWRDRLRILVSGQTMIQVASQTDVLVTRSRSVVAPSVLPPGWRKR